LATAPRPRANKCFLLDDKRGETPKFHATEYAMRRVHRAVALAGVGDEQDARAEFFPREDEADAKFDFLTLGILRRAPRRVAALAAERFLPFRCYSDVLA
jgi:hypothetical protein